VRGFEWAVYVDDGENAWALRVDRTAVTDPGRGWTVEGVEGLVPLPRLWKPRRVVGIDESGREQLAIVSDVAADLWTGAAITFEVEATDGTVAIATVIRREQEIRRFPVAAP
jgi:hypothetical protein